MNEEIIGGKPLETEEKTDYRALNQTLEKQLTKRNEQYIFDLRKNLTAANFDDEKIEKELNEIMNQMINGQKNGQTARQLYGTVQEKATEIIERPEIIPPAKPWQYWLDNSLLLLAVLGAMLGFVSLIGKNKTQGTGLLTLLVAAFAGGLIFYLLYQMIYQYEQPGADRSKKPKMWKSILILTLGTIVWIILYGSTMYLPQALNPVIDPVIQIAIGAAAFGLRYLLKRKYHITGNLMRR